MYNPNKSVYYNPNIEYLFNEDIIEYDMTDGGYSLIREFHLLPESKIVELKKIPRGTERHIAVGKLQRDDREFSKALSDAFSSARAFFVTENKLDDNRIISVKKDAIFTINPCKHTRMGFVNFRKKNTYSSYIRFSSINNLELYYNDEELSIKGISDNVIPKHRLYMYEFLQKIISMIEVKNERVKRFIMNFIEKYKKGELDEEYYLEFNNKSNSIDPFFNYMNILIPLVMIINKVLK